MQRYQGASTDTCCLPAIACRRVMQRYKAGEYVSEEELDFAFAQIEKLR